MEDPLVGKQIREYEILSVIGKGGMGAVYRARHVYLDEERAIKVIRPQFSASRDYLERFIREARILTRLRHPNLVLLYEFGTLDKDIFFMVLELLNGESVLTRIRRTGKIPIDETVRIIRAAALGLHAAHQQGIIHRDISPDNLLIVKQEGSHREITKVIDFGIAKPQLESSFTKSNLYIGKPEYGSPERIGVEGVPVDHRADIYSLGVTMYFMLTGILPFQGKTPWEIMSKHLTEMPAPVTSHFGPGEFPDALNRFILKSMAKFPGERQLSMQQFVEELDGIISPDEERKQDHNTFLEQTGHELRTRLNAIIGYSEILEEDAIDQGQSSYIRDLRKIHAAGKHLLWLIGGSDPDMEVKVSAKSAFEKGKEFYDQMKWEDAIHMWKQARHEPYPDSALDQWLNAAETRLNSEKQIREQLRGLFDRFERLLQEKKIVDAKSLLDDAERISSGHYRITDLRNQLTSLRKKLDSEIDQALTVSGYKDYVVTQQLVKTISFMQENLPELKKALQMIQPSVIESADRPSIVEKTMFLTENGENTENADRRQKPPKTSRRKTKQT